MQTLEIISVNLWNIIISLCNLLVLYFILKKFLYKPVRKVLAARQDEIDAQYMAADVAEKRANAHQKLWEEKMESVNEEAADIIKTATADAKLRSNNILSDAREKADRIIKQAEVEAEIEKRNAESEIKKELAGVSCAIAEKLLNREIQEEDHHDLIDAFIEGIGDSDEEHE